jgi:hypothetical protein
MSLPGHIHISEINLGQITNNPIHYDFGSQILGSGYRGWVVLEMLHDPRNLEICDKQSLLNFLSAYQGAASE